MPALDVRFMLGTLILETAGTVKLKDQLNLNVQPWMLNLLVCLSSGHIAIANDSDLLIVQIPDEAKMLSPEDSTRIFRTINHFRFTDQITNLQKKIVKQQEVLLVCCKDSKLFLVMNGETKNPVVLKKEIIVADDSIWGADIFENKLIVSSNTHFVYLYDRFEDFEPATIFHGHKHNIPCVAFSPYGHFLATSCIDQSVRLYALNDQSFEPSCRTFSLPGDWGWSVGFIPREQVDLEIHKVDYSHFRMKFLYSEEEPNNFTETEMNLPTLRLPYYYWADHTEDDLHYFSQSDDYMHVPTESELAQMSESDAIDETETEMDDTVEDDDNLGDETHAVENQIFAPESTTETMELEETGIENYTPHIEHLGITDENDFIDEQGSVDEELMERNDMKPFDLKEDDSFLYFLSSKNLQIYSLCQLCTENDPAAVKTLYRILYTTVSPDQRALFQNGVLHWEHERYVFAKYVPELSALFLANQLGFITVVALRRIKEGEGETLGTMMLTLPMGNEDVQPLVGMDVCRVDPDNPTYFKLFMLHLDGIMRTYLIRKVINQNKRSFFA